MAQDQVVRSEPLTNMAVDFRPGNLKAQEIFPPVHVLMEIGDYPVFQKDMFDMPDDTRSDGAESKQSSVGWTYVPYRCEEHALHDFITSRQRKNVSSQMDLEGRKARVIKRRVLNNLEARVFGANGILRQAANNGGSANYDLSNPATASPRTMVTTAINAVEVNCGFSPNTIALGKDTARAIIKTAEFREEFKFVREIQTLGNDELPDELYGMKAVYVEALVNTAKKGQARVPTRLMSDDVWIGFVNPDITPEAGIQEEVTYGVSFYTEEYSGMWWKDDNRADKLEYGYIYVPELVAKEAGYLCQSVLTA